MSNEHFLSLPLCESGAAVRLKSGQPHPVYYGPVRQERTASGFRYWFLYQNTARECRTCIRGYEEI